MSEEKKSVLDTVIEDIEKGAQAEGQANQENKDQKVKSEEQSQQQIQEDQPGEKEKKKPGRPKKEEKPEEVKQKPKSFYDEEPEEQEDKTDYKSLWEQADARAKKYESNPFVTAVAEAMEAPDFDAEKFIDSLKPKEIKEMSLEQLWKMDKKINSNLEYTDEELTELWQEEFEGISESNIKQKSLKDTLIGKLKPKVDLGKEPAYVTEMKQKAAAQREQAQKGQEGYNKFISDTTTYVDGFDGAEIVEGLIVDKEAIEEVKKSLTVDYYRNQDGSMNVKKIGKDRVKAAMFDKLVGHLKEMAKAEAKKEVYRPNADSVSGDGNTGQTVVDEAQKAIDAVLGNSVVYQNQKKK
jgi:hypothetical protein